MEGLREEWWLGKISQRCTQVLHLWWSGPGNYIRGTIRALVSPLSAPLCQPDHTRRASCLTPNKMHGGTSQTLSGQQSKKRIFLSRPHFITPRMVCQTREGDLCTCTQHPSFESICSLFIGGRDLGGVIDWKSTSAGEMLYGPSVS